LSLCATWRNFGETRGFSFTAPQAANSTRAAEANQLHSVFDKLGVWSRLELALYVASHGCARWADDLQAKLNEAAAAAGAAS
jgi:hypothetical protein